MSRSREEAEKAGIQIKEIHHNMKRRFPCHNYSDKGTYMITLVVEGRKPLFGRFKATVWPQWVAKTSLRWSYRL